MQRQYRNLIKRNTLFLLKRVPPTPALAVSAKKKLLNRWRIFNRKSGFTLVSDICALKPQSHFNDDFLFPSLRGSHLSTCLSLKMEKKNQQDAVIKRELQAYASNL